MKGLRCARSRPGCPFTGFCCAKVHAAPAGSSFEPSLYVLDLTPSPFPLAVSRQVLQDIPKGRHSPPLAPQSQPHPVWLHLGWTSLQSAWKLGASSCDSGHHLWGLRGAGRGAARCMRQVQKRSCCGACVHACEFGRVCARFYVYVVCYECVRMCVRKSVCACMCANVDLYMCGHARAASREL